MHIPKSFEMTFEIDFLHELIPKLLFVLGLRPYVLCEPGSENLNCKMSDHITVMHYILDLEKYPRERGELLSLLKV